MSDPISSLPTFKEMSRLKAENEQLRKLVRGYYTLLRVVHPGFWEKTMGPFWNKQRNRLQEQAKPFVEKKGQE